jgi:hypothetical protein
VACYYIAGILQAVSDFDTLAGQTGNGSQVCWRILAFNEDTHGKAQGLILLTAGIINTNSPPGERLGQHVA